MFQDRAQAAAPDLYAYKAADESVTSSTVLQNDDHLTVNVKAGRKYVFRFVLHVESPSARLKYSLSGTSTATYLVASSEDDGGVRIAALDSAAAIGTGGSKIVAISGAYEPATDGSFFLKWAQNSSDVITTTVLKGSYLAVWRLV